MLKIFFKNKHAFYKLIVYLIFVFSVSPVKANDISLQTIVVNGLERHYLLYIPSTSSSTNLLMPVVLAFHGGGGTAENFMRQTNLTTLAEREHFIAVFPEGWREHLDKKPSFFLNPQTWNDGSGNYPSGKNQIDDVGFVKAILAELKKNYPVDASRIYAEGFSNGGALVLRLGVEMSDTLAAIAVASPANLYIEDPHPIRSVPFVYTQGSSDPINPYTGGHVTAFGVNEERPPVDRIVQNLVKMDGCMGGSNVDLSISTVRKLTFTNCPKNMEADYYIIGGMGHAWPGRVEGTVMAPTSLIGQGSDAINATEVFWNFMSQFSLPN